MNKELTPLEAFGLLTSSYVLLTEDEKGEYDFIVETALKRLEELEIENSEQFKEKWVQDNLAMTFELNVANKKLKALEIIKEKNVSIPLIKNAFDLNYYNKTLRYYRFKNQCLEEHLTQEEYDLLKEVLL